MVQSGLAAPVLPLKAAYFGYTGNMANPGISPFLLQATSATFLNALTSEFSSLPSMPHRI
jgi:hypothetical protein